MLVHAHPDDETINNGVTMAKYVSEDAAVCLVTCTLGEEGEVLVVGSSRLGPVARVFLGSNSTKIVRSSPVPVVVVPH